MTVTPLFLFSLPRSGSTLVQRVLACHPKIATTSEPWILLPLLSTYTDTEVFAEYVHHAAQSAIADFAATLPDGMSQYKRELHDLVLRLYAAQSNNDTQYFLDKTPRYHLIATEIVDLFPEAKFLFLWRNPLAIASSMIESFSSGRWNIYRFKVDLYKGLVNLINTYQAMEGLAQAVRYEDLVSGHQDPWRLLFEDLGLSFDPSVLSDFAHVEIRGRMKDFTGIRRHKEITDGNIEKWVQTFRSPVRKRWARRYLEYLGKERLELMGYKLADFHSDLDQIGWSAASVVPDLARELFGLVYVWTEPGIIKKKLKMLPKTTGILKHG